MIPSLQYIAGFFDGEGCISVFYTNIRPQKTNPEKMIRGIKLSVLISNTDQKPLLLFQKLYGGYIHLSNRKKKDHHKSVSSWRLSEREAQKKFLTDILPHSIVKSEQIRLALEYLSTKGLSGQRISQQDWDIRIRCLEALAKLNKRGLGAVRAMPPLTITR